MILIDTHAFLWIADGHALGDDATAAVAMAHASGALFASSVSAWEFGMLTAKGRLTLVSPVKEWWTESVARCGFRILPLDADTAFEATRLPGALHADPADRFLIATARRSNLKLVTADRAILAYAKAGHVKAIRAR